MYRLNSGAWTPYSTVVTIAQDGLFLVEWYAVDVAGNIGEESNLTIKMDTTDPSTVIEPSGFDGDGWGNGSALCMVTANDAGSGLAHIYYRLDGGVWREYSGTIGFTTTGTHLVECYAVDLANNSGTVVNVTCKIDLTPPVSELDLSGLLDGSDYLNSVTVNLSSSDVGCGESVIKYKLDDGPWTVTNAAFAIDEPGTYILWYGSMDALNNTETPRSVTLTVKSATVPGQVNGLVVVKTAAGALRLQWDAAEDGGTAITAYSVYRSLNGGAVELLATVIGTTYVDEAVAEGDSCSYYVIAENLLGDGEQSLTVTGEIPVEDGSGNNTVMIVAVIAIVVVILVLVVVLLYMRKKK
jgi:hypothetical protein